MGEAGVEEIVPYAITRCPTCRTLFRVTETQLLSAEGAVRCGSCLHVFQAEDQFVSPLLDVTELLAIRADYWEDFERWVYQVGIPDPETMDMFADMEFSDSDADAPVAKILSAPETPSGTEPMVSVTETLEMSIEEPEPPLLASNDFIHVDEKWHDDHPAGEISIDIDHEQEHGHLVQDLRSFRDWRGLKWLPAIALACVAIGIQYAYFHMETYAQDPAYRPHYLTACRYLPCKLPEYSDPDQLQTRELVVRSHPGEANALIVDVLLRNTASFRQVFPGLRLSFFNIKGEKVATRIFGVSDYLGGEMRGLKFIPARTEVRLSLELVDPGKDALGYEMEIVRR